MVSPISVFGIVRDKGYGVWNQPLSVDRMFGGNVSHMGIGGITGSGKDSILLSCLQGIRYLYPDRCIVVLDTKCEYPAAFFNNSDKGFLKSIFKWNSLNKSVGFGFDDLIPQGIGNVRVWVPANKRWLNHSFFKKYESQIRKKGGLSIKVGFKGGSSVFNVRTYNLCIYDLGIGNMESVLGLFGTMEKNAFREAVELAKAFDGVPEPSYLTVAEILRMGKVQFAKKYEEAGIFRKRFDARGGSSAAQKLINAVENFGFLVSERDEFTISPSEFFDSNYVNCITHKFLFTVGETLAHDVMIISLIYDLKMDATKKLPYLVLVLPEARNLCPRNPVRLYEDVQRIATDLLVNISSRFRQEQVSLFMNTQFVDEIEPQVFNNMTWTVLKHLNSIPKSFSFCDKLQYWHRDVITGGDKNFGVFVGRRALTVFFRPPSCYKLEEGVDVFELLDEFIGLEVSKRRH